MAGTRVRPDSRPGPAPAASTVEEHLVAVLGAVAPRDPEHCPVGRAHGLVLAVEVRAVIALPPFDNSAMDGYAVRVDDVAAAAPGRPVTLRVVADLPAGADRVPVLAPGTCARIMTGAPVPATAEAVVPVEATDGGVDRVVVRAAARPGEYVRRAGEDVRPGDLVLAAGTLLGPAQVGGLVATGSVSVPVHPRPRVGIVSTGSEIVPPGVPLGRGLVPDSNGILLAAAVRDAGCDVVEAGVVPDDTARLRAILDHLLQDREVDAVLTSGGVSVGEHDVVKALLAGWDPGGVTFTTVAMQPGKPQGFGVLTGRSGRPVPLFALPGNPVSAYVSFEVFVRPALRLLRGLPRGEAERPVESARAGEGWVTPPGRRQYIPVAASRGPAGWTVRPAGPRGSGSHLAVTLAAADGLAVVAADVERVRAGDTVGLMLTREGPR